MSNELTEAEQFRVMHYGEIAELIRAFHAKFGDEVYQTVEKVNGEKTFSEWQEKAKTNVSNSIEDLLKLLWEPLKNEGFQYEEEKTATGYQMRCTYCPVVDLAKYLGINKEAFHMFCSSDYYIVDGFNPKIGLKRTKTLMQGDDCCDHFYYMK